MKFTTLLTMSQAELLQKLEDIILCKKKAYNVVKTSYALGFYNNPDVPTLVAHLDTINTHYSQANVSLDDIIVTDKYIMLSPEANEELSCLGADDRCGVMAILELLDFIDIDFNILFTTNEEIGCKGSDELIKDFNKDFHTWEYLLDSACLIQIDRGQHENAWNEIVFYDYDYNHIPEFYNKLMEYYTLAQGSYTDVALLGQFFNVPIANVSASYKNEHTRQEFINLEWFYKNLESLYYVIKWTHTQYTSGWDYSSIYSECDNYGLELEDVLSYVCDFDVEKAENILDDLVIKGYDYVEMTDRLWESYFAGYLFNEEDFTSYITEEVQ